MANIDQSVMEKKKVTTKWLIMASVMLGTFMAPLDASIVNTILYKITEYFETDITIGQWVPTVYLLTISSLILLYGRLGDMVGYKKIFITGLTGFIVASILCGSSQSIWMLISFRAIQGLVAGMIMAVGVAIITSVFPPNERGKAMGIYAISISAALGLGPTLGGLIAEYLSWHYVFFINVPIGIAAIIWGLRVIPSGSTIPGQRFDVAGAITATIFLLTLLLYANRGEYWGWASPLSLSLLGIAVLFGIIFYIIERKSTQPMLELSLFNSRRFSLASFSALLMFMALYTVVFLTPFFLDYVLGYNSTLRVGLVMAASPIATLIVAPICGTLSDRVGTRIFTVCGMCIAALGLFLLSGLNESSHAWDVVWRITVTGSGIGMFQSPNNSRIMGSVSPRYMGIASGVIAAMRNVGMVFGIAVAGAVLSIVAHVVNPHDPSFNIQGFISGVHWAFIAAMGLAIFAALTSLAAVDKQGPQAKAGMPPPSPPQVPPGN